MAQVDKSKAQRILNRIMEIENEFERDDSISSNQVETDIKKIVEDIVDAIKID